MKKTLCLVIALVLLFTFVACGDDGLKYSSYGPYDPYYNNYKEGVPTGRKYSVKGKTFYFEKNEDDLMIRDKDGIKQTEAESSLESLYIDISVVFHSEDTVEFKDAAGSTFSVPPTKGVREKNVLTIQHTNAAGRTYDVRIEIHKEKIIVIHDGHTYNNPGTYATIIFYE